MTLRRSIQPIIFSTIKELGSFIHKMAKTSLHQDELSFMKNFVVTNDGNTYYLQDIDAALQANKSLPELSFPLADGSLLEISKIKSIHDFKQDMLVFNKPLAHSLYTLLQLVKKNQKPIINSGLRCELDSCPITKNETHNPVITRSGRHYDYFTLHLWLITHNTDPISNQPLSHDDVFKNLAMESFTFLYYFSKTDRLTELLSKPSIRVRKEEKDKINQLADNLVKKFDNEITVLYDELKTIKLLKAQVSDIAGQYPGKQLDDIEKLLYEKHKKLSLDGSKNIYGLTFILLGLSSALLETFSSIIASTLTIYKDNMKFPLGAEFIRSVNTTAKIVAIMLAYIVPTHFLMRNKTSSMLNEKTSISNKISLLSKLKEVSHRDSNDYANEVLLTLDRIKKLKILASNLYEISSDSKSEDRIITIDDPNIVSKERSINTGNYKFNELSSLMTTLKATKVNNSSFFAKSLRAVRTTFISQASLERLITVAFFSYMAAYLPLKTKRTIETFINIKEYIKDKKTCFYMLDNCPLDGQHVPILSESCTRNSIKSFSKENDDISGNCSLVEIATDNETQDIKNACYEACKLYPLSDVYTEPWFIAMLIGNFLLLLSSAFALYKNYVHEGTKKNVSIEEIEETEVMNP